MGARRWLQTVIDTVCWCYPAQGPECGPCLFSPGSWLQALEMESVMGLGVAAMQGAPCQSFPIAAASILRNQVRAHAPTHPRTHCPLHHFVHLRPICSPSAPRWGAAARNSTKCEVRIPTWLEVTD